MKLFLTGATGYIGFSVATAFRQAGHQVWGLTRSVDRALMLSRNEIKPVIGSLQQPYSFRAIAAASDVLVHTAIDDQTNSAALDGRTVQLLLEVAQQSAEIKTFIYTSGTWVYGNTEGRSATEKTPLAPAREVAWRPKVEKMVLEADGVRGIIIRPGIVYGQGGGMTAPWFDRASNGGVIRIVGDGRNHWAMVHVDDLAHGYVRAAESNLGGEIFNLVDPSRATVIEMVDAAARAAGDGHRLEFVPVDEAAKEMGAMAEAHALDQIIDASKAHRLLDWQPQHQGFISEVDTCYEAWEAQQQS
jgi:nucleoside-diphosphate-sugar epimerase